MTTYRAWDQNDYPWPPPEGWYQAVDDLWWPEGYGPGPAPAVPEPVAPEPVAFEPAPADPTTTLSTDPTSILPTQPVGMGPPPGTVISQLDRENLPTDGLPFGAPEPSAPAYAAAPPASFEAAPPGYAAAPPPGYGAPGYAAPANYDAAAPGYDAAAPGYDSSAGSPPSSSKKLILGVVGAVAALLVVGAIAFTLRDGGDDGGPVAFDPNAAAGTAANPHGFGETVRLTFDDPDSGDQVDWKIQLLTTASPQSGGPELGEGESFVGSGVRLEYVGGAETPNPIDFDLVTVGPDGDRRSLETCPDDALVNRVLSPGEVVEGNICWVVPSGALGSTTMIVKIDGVDGAVHLSLQ